MIERPVPSATARAWRSTRRWRNVRCAAPTAAAVNVDLLFKDAKAQIIEAFEREYIGALLKKHGGNLSPRRMPPRSTASTSRWSSCASTACASRRRRTWASSIALRDHVRHLGRGCGRKRRRHQPRRGLSAGPFRGATARRARSTSRRRPACTVAGQPPVLLTTATSPRRAGRCTCWNVNWSTAGTSSISYPLGTVNWGDIRDSAGLIARKVESLIVPDRGSRASTWSLGHSLGGLVGLYYLKRLGGRYRVRRLHHAGDPDPRDVVGAFGLR